MKETDSIALYNSQNIPLFFFSYFFFCKFSIESQCEKAKQVRQIASTVLTNEREMTMEKNEPTTDKINQESIAIQQQLH